MISPPGYTPISEIARRLGAASAADFADMMVNAGPTFIYSEGEGPVRVNPDVWAHFDDAFIFVNSISWTVSLEAVREYMAESQYRYTSDALRAMNYTRSLAIPDGFADLIARHDGRPLCMSDSDAEKVLREWALTPSPTEGMDEAGAARRLMKKDTEALFQDFAASFVPPDKPKRPAREAWRLKHGVTRRRMGELVKAHAPIEWTKRGRPPKGR